MLNDVIEPQVISDLFVPPEPPPLPAPPPPPWIYEVKSLTQFIDGAIDCEVLHETLGWIPFTAMPSDTAPATLAVFQYIEENNIDVETLPLSPNIASNTVSAERTWRNHELTLADVELLKAEDADPTSVGTPAQWRQYRVELRNWPQSADFPNSAMRPVRPVA